MFCNKCGQKLSDDSLFCQYCGNKIERQLVGSVEEPASQPMRLGEVENRKEFKYPSGTKSCWIVGILLLLSYIEVWHPYAESEYYNFAYLLGGIEFCILNLIMMPLPMFVGVLMSNISPRKIKVLCAVNSIMVFATSLVLVYFEIIEYMFIGWIVALFYYFINKHILLQIKKHSCDKKKSILVLLCTFAILIAMLAGGVKLFNHIAEKYNTVVDGAVNTSEEISNDETVNVSDKSRPSYYVDIVDKVYKLEGHERCAIVRSILCDDKETAEYIYGKMETANFDEEEIIKIMDEYGTGNAGGTGYLIEPGDCAKEIDNWCFASDRESDDIAIIKTSEGYYIFYISYIFQ